ncbi:uncharacterized protein F4812DRAFT_426190 [Daldinia caldariorum]|uniref:uncharacterized protein n=1 Tax=Daldinia caldariorum TaxID=326644 RepID=UPI002008968D|nr:uncharacterized protein F4812DRAFT_426190 [Daldinia caldariorum]KAI1468289.1 hypothetical protein F4812DRAFT_426190 [Daldinia caldariorum]
MSLYHDIIMPKSHSTNTILTKLSSTLTFPCDNPGCINFASFACPSCLLVQYCSRECQKADVGHEIVCKSEYANPEWSPQWFQEGRQPTYFDQYPPHLNSAR